MKHRLALWSAGLLVCSASFGLGVRCAAVEDTPTTPLVLQDFEKDDAGTTPLGGSTTSQNTDKQFATEGSKGSLKIDVTGVSGWNELAEIPLPEAKDLSKYAFISVDVIIPPDSHPTDGWWMNGGLVTMDPYTSGGDHDFHDGVNHLVSYIPSAALANVTKLRLYSNEGAAWTGPIYVDNIKALPGKPQGLVPGSDQVLVAGWNKDSEIASMTMDWPAEINKDKAYVTEGDGSLKLDLMDQSGWVDNKNQVNDLAPLDLSAMDQVRLDVFVPQGSLSDWNKFGLVLITNGGDLFFYQHTLQNGSQTLVYNLQDLSTDDKAKLKEVIGYRFRCQSGQAFAGPIYVDALRGSKELAGVVTTPVPPAVKGDVSGNGKLDVQDVVFTLRFVAGLAQPTDVQKSAADVNGNGKADVQDVVMMLRAVAGLAPIP